MNQDAIRKYKEISLLDSELNEEMIRYELTYDVVLHLGMPTHISIIKAVRIEFRDGQDDVREVTEDDLPYFMFQNLQSAEINEVS